MSQHHHEANKPNLLPRLLVVLLFVFLVIPSTLLQGWTPLEASSLHQADKLAPLEKTILAARYALIGGWTLLLLAAAAFSAHELHELGKDSRSADPDDLRHALNNLPELARNQIARHFLLLMLAAATLVNLLQTPSGERELLMAGVCLLGLSLLLSLRAALYPLEALLVRAFEVLRRNLPGHALHRVPESDNREIRVTLPEHRSALPGLLATALALVLLAGGALYLEPTLLDKLLA